MWKWETTWSPLFFHIICISFLHFWTGDPRPDPKPAAGRARDVPRTATLGPGPRLRAPEYENKFKSNTQKCENHVIVHFRIIFTFPRIIFIFLSHVRRGTQMQSPEIIFVSYYWSNLCHNMFMFLYVHGAGAPSIPQSLKPRRHKTKRHLGNSQKVLEGIHEGPSSQPKTQIVWTGFCSKLRKTHHVLQITKSDRGFLVDESRVTLTKPAACTQKWKITNPEKLTRHRPSCNPVRLP
jgi:hypothetical protein